MRVSGKWQMMVACALVCIVAATAYGGTTGKLAGRVTDAESGEAIPGAAVTVEGTALGGLTDTEGFYTILNVEVGAHTVRCEIVGYAPVVAEQVRVSIDLTTTQDFRLTTQAVELGAVTVTAERPMVLPDQTSSLRIVTGEEVQNLPTRGYQDIVGLQTGAVRYNDNAGIRFRGGRESSNTGSINLRGGRASEVAYFVDGFSQQDPLTGLSTSQINNNAIEEVSVVSGGFNAEYGLIMSGAVHITTKGGARVSDYKGTLELVTDNFHGDNYDYNVYSATLSGPLLPGNDNVSFYLAGERRWTGDRDPHATAGGMLDHNSAGLWNYQAKLNWRLSGNANVKFGSVGSQEKWEEYNHFYLFNQEHGPRYVDQNYSFWGSLTHTVNPKTFYTAAGSWFSTERERGDGTHFDDIFGYGRPHGNPRNESTQHFRSWDDLKIDDNGDQIVTEAGDTTISVPMPDGSTQDIAFVNRDDEGHVWDDYLHRKSSYYGGEFDLVSQVHPNHELKVGVEFQRHTLRRYRHLFPVRIYLGTGGGFTDIDHYGYDELGNESDAEPLNGAKNPVNIGAYLQDKFEWEGLVVNAGVRYDYFDYKTLRLRNEELPLDPDSAAVESVNPDPTNEERVQADSLTIEDLEDSQAESRVSPRLGVAFPVADGSVLHFSYGKFFQRPDLQNLYVNYDFLAHKVRTGGYFFPFGNPNLEPEETTAYEVGWRRQVSDYSVIDVTAFYKDIKSLTEVVNQPSIPNNFATYRNTDYGTVKGIEFQLDMRRNRGVSAQFNYTLQFAEGTGSFANTQRNVAWTVSQPPKGTSALTFDQRHKVTAILDIRGGAKAGPKLGDFYPLENAGVNFVFNAGSGFPYTPSLVFNEVTLGAASPVADGQVNSRYAPWTNQLDLKANRQFMMGNTTFDLYLWVINVFDRENIVDVYESSGQATSTGWLETDAGQTFVETNAEPDDTSGLTGEEKYILAQTSPLNFGTPRQIRFGIRWLF